MAMEESQLSGGVVEERAQAAARCYVSATLLAACLVIAWLAGLNPVSAYGYLAPSVLLHTVLCVLVWQLSRRAECLSRWRVVGSCALDFVFATLALMKMGAAAAVVWLVYLWIALGNGMRYGNRYLLIMTGFALMASSTLYLWGGYWREQWQLTLSLQGGLLLVPLFYRRVIGQVHREHAALRDAVASSRSLAEAKSQFLANMSHELRTPLNGVLGVAQLLQERVEDARSRELVALLKRSARSLIGVIDDVLDVSKLDADRVTLESRSLDLKQLSADVAQLFLPRANEKGLELSWRYLGEPEWVRGDDTRLRQILTNLVSNAVKFTERGRVEVTARARRAAAGDLVQVDLEVRDTGIGIEPEQMERIFEQFEQADVSTTRRFGGTGLGLAISKRLVLLMDGKITTDSVPGRGSRFCVQLELPAGVPPAAADEPGERRFCGRAVIAEDNPVNQLVARRLLEQLGLTVTVVADGARVVAETARHDYDLVLMDLQMPVMGGAEAARRIRERGGDVAIVALSADASGLSKAGSAGVFDAFMAKPVDRRGLVATLDGLLSTA